MPILQILCICEKFECSTWIFICFAITDPQQIETHRNLPLEVKAHNNKGTRFAAKNLTEQIISDFPFNNYLAALEKTKTCIFS